MKANGDHQGSSLQLQQQRTGDNSKAYAAAALKQCRYSKLMPLLEYGSVIKMIEYLRHRNPDCALTIVSYLKNLNQTLKVLNYTTPDYLVHAVKEADVDQVEALFLDLDGHWLEELNSTSTRQNKWASLKTFLTANVVRKASLIKCNIRNRKRTIDYALTKEDCRQILNNATDIGDKLAVTLLIETLQRIGTISLLTWGDVQPHLAKGEDIFMVWIDPGRTKCNIGHWAPIGPLSSYYIRKRLEEIRGRGKEVSSETRLISDKELGPIRTTTLIQRLHRIMMSVGVLGKKQGQGHMTRYEKHVHCFRKFGVVEMQRQGVNEEVIRFLMGQKRDTYSEWTDRYDELLEIYRSARPTLDQKDALQDIVEYANSRGYSLDPKYLQLKVGTIRVYPDPHPNGSQGAEASMAFTSSQK